MLHKSEKKNLSRPSNKLTVNPRVQKAVLFHLLHVAGVNPTPTSSQCITLHHELVYGICTPLLSLVLQ